MVFLSRETGYKNTSKYP